MIDILCTPRQQQYHSYRVNNPLIHSRDQKKAPRGLSNSVSQGSQRTRRQQILYCTQHTYVDLGLSRTTLIKSPTFVWTFFTTDRSAVHNV